MTSQVKLTKRQREVVDMMHNGWSLQTQVSRTKGGKHRAFLFRSENQFGSQITEISFTIVDALQKAHLIRPVSSLDNQRVWVYDLTERKDTTEELVNQ